MAARKKSTSKKSTTRKKPAKKSATRSPRASSSTGQKAGGEEGAGQAWPADEVVRRKVSGLVPYARNSRNHSPEQVKEIMASIREWGWTTPVLIDEEGTIIAGHARVMAANQLGIEEIPVMVARGWTDAQKRAYVIADNKLALNATWNREMLKVELGELSDADFDMGLLGFTDLELKGLSQGEFDFGEGYDKKIEAPENPVTESGDLWVIGDHRLLCGDSTDENCVTWLLDGAKPGMMVTDPPYGVNYDPEWRKREGVNKEHHETRVGEVLNDDRDDWAEAWKLFPGQVAYVWHASTSIAVVQRSLIEAGFDTRYLLIWAKSNFTFGRGHYHWGHEPLWYCVRRGAKSRWVGDRNQSTVWSIKNIDDGDKNQHSTQKPIECMGRPISNHDFEEVYEPFAGSGTTMVAAQLAGRRCYAIELNPAYVDVIIKRMQDRFDVEAVHEKTGKTYAQLAGERVTSG